MHGRQCASQALASLNAKQLYVTRTKVHNLCPQVQSQINNVNVLFTFFVFLALGC